MSQYWSHTVPHRPFTHTSTRPSYSVLPPTSRKEPVLHRATCRYRVTGKQLWCLFWHIIKFTNNWVTLLLQLAYECIVFQLVGILYSMQTVDSIPRDSEFPTLNGILCCNIERRSLIFFKNTVLFAGVCYWHTCNAFATNSHEYTSGTVGNCKLRRIGSDWESECSLCI